MTVSTKRFTGRLLACASVVALASGTVGMAAAHPGHPGQATDAPTVLLHEDFENGQAASGLTQLEDYTAANGLTYTADAEWLNYGDANGLIVDGTTSDGDIGAVTAAPASKLREVATALGELNNTVPPASNHAVTAYTAAVDPTPNKIEFQTVTPINLNVGGRFLTVSVNAAVVNCDAAHPQLVFYLDDSGTETRVNNTPLDPCGGNTDQAAHAVTLTGGNAALFSGDTVGIIMRNEQGSQAGNDHAFDDIKLLDATPQLDKQFADEQASQDEPLKPGTVTNLVLTVTNTSELAEKTGWSFIDHLPSGLTVAGDVTSTCTADVAAPTGSTTVDVSNGSLAQGQPACEVTVPVTSAKGGVFENSADNIESVGLNAPASTTVEFAAPPAPAAPDTGAERTEMWPYYAALLAGLAVVGVGGQQLITRRRR